MRPVKQKTYHTAFMQKTLHYFHDMARDYAPRPVPFTLVQLREWLAEKMEAGCRCAYCEKSLSIEILRLDHMHPTSRSGSLGLENLTPCCHTDNVQKGELTAEEYRFLLRGIQSMPETAQKYILKKLRTRPIFRGFPGKEKDGSSSPKSKTKSQPKERKRNASDFINQYPLL